MKHIKLFEQFVNEVIEIKSVEDHGVSNSNKYDLIKKHSGIIDILKDPDQWTDDLVFVGSDKKKYSIDDLIDREVRVGSTVITVEESFVNEFEDFLNEAAGNDVVFFPGRFQPFHNGHLAALKRTSEVFGKPVVALQILSAREESPFPDSLLQRMAKDVVRNNPFIKDFVIYPTGRKTVIPLMVQYLRDLGYESYGLGAGADRMKDYQRQVEYITGPKTDTPVDPSFAVKLVDTREGDGPSGTKVRQALKDDDRAAFNKLMPKELHKYYDELKKYID